MPVPTAMEGWHDQLLTDFSVGFNDVDEAKYIATKVFPVVDVAKQASTFRRMQRGYFYQDQVAPRPEGGVPREVEYRMTTGTYFCEEEGLRAKLDKNEAANWVGSTDPRENKIRLLTNQHKIHREIKFVNAFLRAGVWGRDRAGVAAGPAGDQFLHLSDPSVDLVQFWRNEKYNRAEIAGEVPNTLVMGVDVFASHADDTGIKDQLKYTSSESVTPDILARVLGFERILVPEGTFNSGVGEILNTATGLPVPRETYSFIVPRKSMLLLYTDPNAQLNSITGGVHFAWNQVGTGNYGASGPSGGGGFNSAVFRGLWDYGEWFDVLQAFTPAVVNPQMGVFYQTAVA